MRPTVQRAAALCYANATPPHRFRTWFAESVVFRETACMPAPSASFDGLRVAAFESRRADETARMIERFGGVALVSPSMREVPVEADRSVVEFAHRLITGQIDVVILLTGVGTREMLARAERRVDRQRFLDALADVKTLVRGPKPLAVLKELGITPTAVVPEPNTWREVLADDRRQAAGRQPGGRRAGVRRAEREPGRRPRSPRRGGRVVQGLPLGPARRRWPAARPTSSGSPRGEIDVAMFTSAQQVVHLLQRRARDETRAASSRRPGRTRSSRRSARPPARCCSGNDLPVDFEPSHPKLGHLVSETAALRDELLDRKRSSAESAIRIRNPQSRPTSSLQSARQSPQRLQPPAWHDSPFLRACRREPTPYTPIWLMRQAGRYMPEYRAVREKTTFLELCKNPQLSSEVMCTAVERLGVDAAIIFSDLLPILEPMGMELEFAAGDGPQYSQPGARVGRRRPRHRARKRRRRCISCSRRSPKPAATCPTHIPLIGFAGAPFTLASYAIEGGSSRTFLHTKTLMYREPAAWRELMERLSRTVTRYLNAQIAAGAQAVQLFDSWVGCLSPGDYREFVLPYVRTIAEGLTPGAPLIHFGTGNPALLPLMAEAGGDVIGLDWRVDLADGWKTVGHDRAVQGNLDPAVLLADRDSIAEQAGAILAAAAGRPGHIFNLGHGVLQQTPVDNVRALVEIVHEASAR